MTAASTTITAEQQYDQIVKSAAPGTVLVLDFWADWAAPCAQMNDVFDELARLHGSSALQFLKIEAEVVYGLSEKFDIAAVPTMVFVQGGKVIERVEGAKAAELTLSVEKYAKRAEWSAPLAPATGANPEAAIEARLKKLTTMAPIVLFMKGTPDMPQCGFSRQIVGLLDELDIKYSHFNILEDQVVREKLKAFANWPTYPQVWINGELVGGLDIVKEMIASGDLQEMLPKQESLADRLDQLIRRAPVMIFIKGSPDQPRCGFSRQLIEILTELQITFDSFDILEDEEVRQGLKAHSNWPTFPQVYIHGELVGGLDIVKEMVASGDFQAMIQPQQAQ